MDSQKPALAPHEMLAQELASAATFSDARSTIDRWRDVLLEMPRPAPPRNDASDRSIGIWRPTMINSETWFVRDKNLYQAQAHLWADVERIGPKRHRKRVVFVGESCARGYPYDPLFNCTSALTTFMRTVRGGEDVEVVDLAACGIKPEALFELLSASTALEADAYVVFAGNNWVVDPYMLDFDAIAARLLEIQEWSAIVPYVHDVVRRRTESWMSELAAVCSSAGAPVLFVLPAENMQDCPLPTEAYNPVLGSREQARREELMDSVGGLIAAGEFAEAEPLAAALTALEDGFSVSGLQSLGRCALARGALAEATRLFEAAREMFAYLPIFGLNSHSIRTEVLRTRAVESGLSLVDLPRRFIEIGNGCPPGRDLFLDHCHMTSRGIAVAMAETTERLLPLLGLAPVPADALLETPLHVEPRALAQAHFLTAQLLVVHHEDLARYHCQRALESTAEIAEVMRHYLTLISSREPFALCEAYYHFKCLECRFPALRGLGPQQPFSSTNAALHRIIADAIRTDLTDDHSENDSKANGCSEEIDLLPYAEIDAFSVRFPTQQRAYIKYFRHKTRFNITAIMPQTLRLRLTTRASDTRSAGKEASLLVNGHVVHSWLLQPEWSTVQCIVHSRPLNERGNVLTIAWPDPGQRREDRLQQISNAFRSRRMFKAASPIFEFASEIYTVYGEIWSFTASDAKSRVGLRYDRIRADV